MLRAHVHTDRPFHVRGKFQSDRLRTVHGHEVDGQPAVAAKRHHRIGPRGSFRGVDRGLDEKGQQSGRDGHRVQHCPVPAEGKPVQGHTDPCPDNRVRDWAAHQVETGRIAVATVEEGPVRQGEEIERGRVAGRVHNTYRRALRQFGGIFFRKVWLASSGIELVRCTFRKYL